MNLIDVLNWMDTASADEIQRVQEQLKFKQNMNVWQFNPGDRVKFDGGRNRGMKHGVFVKRLTKNVEVLVDGVKWRVSPNLIQADSNPPTSFVPSKRFIPTLPPSNESEPEEEAVEPPKTPVSPVSRQTISELIKARLEAAANQSKSNA